MLIYVLDHHPLVGEMISMLILRICPEARILTVDSLKKLNSLINKYETADFVFMEPQSVDCFGSTGIAHIAERLPNATIVAITHSDYIINLNETNNQHKGLYSIINKKDSVKNIFLTLKKLISTQSTELIQINPKIDIIKITKRHRQLLSFLDQGCTNQQIAERLGIKDHTVKVHFFRLFKILGVQNRLQALNKAKTNGWVPDPFF